MDQGDRASEIVKNLLEFSRASHPRIEEANLEEVVNRTFRLVKNELDLHRIRYLKEVELQFSTASLGQRRVAAGAVNLFMNGIQAMDKGGELKVVIGAAETPAEARIDVIDTGPTALRRTHRPGLRSLHHQEGRCRDWTRVVRQLQHHQEERRPDGGEQPIQPRGLFLYLSAAGRPHATLRAEGMERFRIAVIDDEPVIGRAALCACVYPSAN